MMQNADLEMAKTELRREALKKKCGPFPMTLTMSAVTVEGTEQSFEI